MVLILAIARRDLAAIWLSAFGLGCGAGFVALSGVLLVLDLRSNQADLSGWFSPLFVVLALLAALFSVRAFAEEERSGSLECILTMPVSIGQVVAGKILGAMGALAVALGLSAVCPLLLEAVGHPDPGPILTGYVGLVLAAAGFVAVACAVSAATGSFLAAATGAGALLMALWFGGILAETLSGATATLLSYLSPSSHITGFLRGTLALDDTAYFLGMVVIGAMATSLVLRLRR